MQNSAVAAMMRGRRAPTFVLLALSFLTICSLALPGWSISAQGEFSGGGDAVQVNLIPSNSGSMLSLYPLSALGVVGGVHTVTATLFVNQGKACDVASATFEVLSGPNAGVNGCVPFDISFHAVFSYTGSGGVGTDLIRAYCDVVGATRVFSGVVTMDWIVLEGDCNNNQINDADEIARGLAEDCNENGIPDECDIRDGTSFDCNLDGIPDECLICPPVDLIFVMDTSGSMGDESDALCANIATAASDLAELGISVAPRFLGITDTYFPCLEDYVTNLIGTSVPGSSSCGTNIQTDEDWGPAVAALAERYPWTPGNIRLIIPISDEGPCRGNPCEDPGTDRDSITNAITIAVNNNCFVSPITGTGASECVITLAQALAAGTRGITFISTNPAEDFAQAIFDVVSQACQQAVDCNGNGIPDECDINSGYSQDLNQNGVPDECEVQSSEFKVLDKFGGVFNVGNVSPFWDLELEPPCGAVDLAGTRNCGGLVVLDGRGLLYRYGAVSEALTGRDYGCCIARDVEVTPSGEGCYVLSGFGTVETFGMAPHFGSAFFGTFSHPIDAAEDLELFYGYPPDKSSPSSEASGYYILNCLGQVRAFGCAPLFGEAQFGYDIARAMEVAPDGMGYAILDGYGQVHGFGSLETNATKIAIQNPFFGVDIARDFEITPAGLGWHILDGYGNILNVGDAHAVNNQPLVSDEDVFVDLERCGSNNIIPAASTDGVALILKQGQAEVFTDKEEPPTYALESTSSGVSRTPSAVLQQESSPTFGDQSGPDEASLSSQVTVKFEGKGSLASKEEAGNLVSLVSALVQSCQGTSAKATTTQWRKARNEDSSLYLRFRTPVSVLSASGKSLTLNALVVPLDGESAERRVLLLSDPKSIGEYMAYEGYDAAPLKNLIDAVRK